MIYVCIAEPSMTLQILQNLQFIWEFCISTIIAYDTTGNEGSNSHHRVLNQSLALLYLFICHLPSLFFCSPWAYTTDSWLIRHAPKLQVTLCWSHESFPSASCKWKYESAGLSLFLASIRQLMRLPWLSRCHKYKIAVEYLRVEVLHHTIRLLKFH